MRDEGISARDRTLTESDPIAPANSDEVDVPVQEPATSAAQDPPDPADEEDLDASDETPRRRRRSISISVRSLVVGIGITALVGALGVMTWLYIGGQRKIDAQARESAATSHAESVGLDYAVNAATMDFKNLEAWKVKLVAGTSPELNKKLIDAVGSLQQVLVPLEWNSTARPLVAKVHSVSNGIYVVDCFVSVQTKTVQAPEALQSTATYSVTIDRNKGWQITDVGGVGAALEQK